MTNPSILVLGATGKTGRRVTTRLRARGVPVRAPSRSSEHRFDWYDDATWAPVLSGVAAAYLVPPLDPGAAGLVAGFVRMAEDREVPRIVLLSGRGVGSPGRVGATYAGSLDIERAVRASGMGWTIVRPSWFAQNFSEDFLLPQTLAGEVRVPTGAGAEPFIDVDDVAAVVTAALLDGGHAGQVYELSGPRTLSFAQAALRSRARPDARSAASTSHRRTISPN